MARRNEHYHRHKPAFSRLKTHVCAVCGQPERIDEKHTECEEKAQKALDAILPVRPGVKR